MAPSQHDLTHHRRPAHPVPPAAARTPSGAQSSTHHHPVQHHNASGLAVELVVCRYSEDVSWVSELMLTARADTRALILNHGEHAALRGHPRALEWKLRNAGNECGCYLAYIARTYPHFAMTTLFVQAADGVGLACLCSRAPFSYLGRGDWRNLSSGGPNSCPGYVARSCELSGLFGRRCERTSLGGLRLSGPGHANFQVQRERLLVHPLSTWRALSQLVDGSRPRYGTNLCSNRGRTRWFDCLVMERLWHTLMGEPGELRREQAIAPLPPAARCASSCPLACRGCRAVAPPG